MSSKNRGNTCRAHVVSTTRSGTGVKYGLGVFRKGKVTDDDLREERCS
jgi:hypothetical protein